MKRLYNVGSWSYRKGRRTVPRSLTLELIPFKFCQIEFIEAYGTIKHNLACAVLTEGEFKQVVMSTIFHFTIFDIDRVC